VLLVFAAIAGGAGAWVLKNKTHNEFLSILLSFSGAYLLGVIVLHLLPEVFAHAQNTNPDHAHDYSIALCILAGFFIQLIIVQFTRGIEHGHLHLHDHLSKGYVIGVLFGLSVHALLEGIPLSDSSIDQQQIQSLFWAIFIHKIPEAFALATVLFFSIQKPVYAAFFILCFACLTPLGSVLSNNMINSSERMNWLIAIVCGSLIHISTTIIFEASGKAHKISWYKFLAILTGASISLLTL
jgi:zinc transporter ZupT